MTGLTGLQIISTHRLWALSRKLLIGWLAISGVFPASVQAEIWNRAAASGMNDVAVAPDGLIWLTGKHGAVWLSDNMYGSSFAQIRAEGCNRIAVGPDSTVWCVGSNGNLWTFANGNWSATAAEAMEDVAIAADGTVWLVARNGTVWLSNDRGETLTQLEGDGMSRIAVAPNGVVWAVRSDGTLWKFVTGQWVSIAVGGITDVAVAPNGLICYVGKDGTIWRSSDGGNTFSQDEPASGLQNIAAGRGGAWAVGIDGTVWRNLFSPQF
ncbi:MAG: hypothetical protein KBC53_07740 [Nitrosomonas sp.]|jgi:photosystem II stability/assembly factor-like uncharacterized protein|nr:hypothetical protein [Nitrosomonas sp.]